MIDYQRLERGASGVERRALEQMDVDQLSAAVCENERLRQVIDVQKCEISRLKTSLA
jgi:hypothetical protein